MPTRYLKPGIRDSELIDGLSAEAEVLFYRLLVTVDDFGRANARPSMVKAACFTHVVLEFDLDVPKLRANISGEQAALDYERLTTISDITVILPPTLAEVEPGDILILKKRNLALKVRDKDRKITADKRRLEWSVSTRVLQPTEALRNIANGFKLY